jgi:hypothetical protein
LSLREQPRGRGRGVNRDRARRVAGAQLGHQQRRAQRLRGGDELMLHVDTYASRRPGRARELRH